VEFGVGIVPPDDQPQSAPREPNVWLDRAFAVSVFVLGCFAVASALVLTELRNARPVEVGTVPSGVVVTVPLPSKPVQGAPITPTQPQMPSPPAAAPVLPPLPETVLGKVPLHSIPDPGGPERNVSPEVANGPSQLGAPASVPKQFSGAVRVSGPNALIVGSVPVQLYGIKAPLADDKCGMAGSEPCATVAQRTMASRLATTKISCQVPSPKPGIIVAFAICLDSQGTDIAGSLVSDGLALADPRQSYDYVGAESIAKGLKRGLWAFRHAPAH
jgi:endonuclease YncB( thermonuclease family)